MEIDIEFSKIKELPRFLAQKVFWVTLILIGVAVIVGLLLGYKYVYLVKQSSPKTSDLTRLDVNKLESVLNRLDKREKELQEVKMPSYDLFELD